MKVNKMKINSFVIVVLLLANVISWAFPLDGIIVFVMGLIFALAFSCNGLSLFVKNKQITFIIVLILFSFVFSISKFGLTEGKSLYLASFIVFGIPSLYISQTPFSFPFLYKVLSFFIFLLFPVILNIDFGDSSTEDVNYGAWMGYSYGIIVVLLGAFLCYLWSENKLMKVLFVIVSCSCLYILLQKGSRGTLIGVMCFFIYYFFKKIKSRKEILSLVIIALIAAYLFRNIFQYIDVDGFFFLSKTEDLSVSGDISNGRFMLYSMAFEGFLSSPLWGCGFASFYDTYGTYPHNFVLQIFYEGGLFWGAILLIPLIGFSSKIILSSNKLCLFYFFIFCIGIVRLFFSSNYWELQYFWFFYGMSLSKKKFY